MRLVCNYSKRLWWSDVLEYINSVMTSWFNTKKSWISLWNFPWGWTRCIFNLLLRLSPKRTDGRPIRQQPLTARTSLKLDSSPALQPPPHSSVPPNCFHIDFWTLRSCVTAGFCSEAWKQGAVLPKGQTHNRHERPDVTHVTRSPLRCPG